MPETSKGKSGRGFAAMTTERRRAIASMGGRAAHERGTAHEWNTDEARAVGSAGGREAHRRGTAHRFTSDEARAAGRLGGPKAGRGRRMGAP